MQCRRCRAENDACLRFCESCGAKLRRVCPSCGREATAGAKFCGRCGTSLSEPMEPQPAAPPELAPAAPGPAGERRQLTMLFCDLVGSTPLSQQLDAEEWRDVIARYQEAASDAVVRLGGHVAKNLGDGLLIYFGWPTAGEDDPERAVRAGLAIVDAMAPLNATLATDARLRLAVRIGIHTGPVVIADDGEVFGETANIAARVQSAAAPDSVVITAATQRLVAGMFVVEDRGPQVLKGIREPVILYHVVQASGVRSRLDLAAGQLTRFVGRDMELGTLIDRWERAAEGDGQSVLLLGEAGVGKSRLAYQLRERLAALPHTWLECRSTPYTAGTPFFQVIELVQQGLGFAPEDTATEKLGKIEHALSAAGFGLTEAVPLTAAFLGVPCPETSAASQISSELQRRKTMELLGAWNLALAEVQPLVLFIEDLHWSDPSSLELLGRIIAQGATARVLLLATTRPQFTPRWTAGSNMTVLRLARLTKRQAREMVMALGGNALPPEMVEMLVTRADGVPLYVEELTKAVMEPGVARGVEAIPATLADSLMARLDRLSTAKEVAQQASVLGREFAYPLVAAMTGVEEAALRQGLARLVEAEILFVRGKPPAATYTFKHALMQEAAYGSLLKRTRQQLHGRVVDVLVKDFPDRAVEPEVVARHAEVAGRFDEAIAFYQRAGEHAHRRSAHEEAIRHLRQAITLLAALPEGKEREAREATLQLGLGGSLAVARGFSHSECEAAYERARVLCEALGDEGQLGLALIGLAILCFTRGEVEQGRVLAARVLAAAEQSGDKELAFQGHLHVAIPELYQGKFASSLANCEAARPLCERERPHEVVSALAGDAGVAALAFAAWNLWQLGWPDRALGRVREAVERARRLGHPFSLAYALFFETVVHWLRRDVTAECERATETIALSEAHDFPFFLGLGRMFHAAACANRGEPGGVAEMLAGLALAAERGSEGGAPALFALLGEVYLAGEQLAEARNAVETGLAVAAQTGQPFFDAELHRLQGEIFMAESKNDPQSETRNPQSAAEGLFQHALDIARAQQARSFELRAATSLACLWRDQGKRAAARDLLAPIHVWFTEGFHTSDLIAAKAVLEEL